MGACTACKFNHRGCKPDCIFARYFPSDDPQKKYDVVHKVFPDSKVEEMLKGLPFLHQREDLVRSLVYEANVRMRDPVYGCVGYIHLLENQVQELQMQLAELAGAQNQLRELQLMPLLAVGQNQVQEVQLMPLAGAQAQELDINQSPPGEDEDLDLDLHL